jgi:hypothetical protein
VEIPQGGSAMPSSINKAEDQSGGNLICSSCHGANHPESGYCTHCSAPLGSTAAWDIQAAGYVVREASSTNRPKPILLAGVWMLFFPLWIGCLWMLWICGVMILVEGQHGYVLSVFVSLFFWILASVILYRGTTNYFRKKSQWKHARKHRAH